LPPQRGVVGVYYVFNQEELTMSKTSLLEPMIQDTAFGQDERLTVQANEEPDDLCYCICGCLTKGVKVANNQADATDAWAGK